MNKLRSLVALPLIAILAVAFAACGGGGDDSLADLDPADVLRQTFSGDHEVDSGVFGLSASADVPGEGGGSGSLSVTAPFNNNGEGEVPDVELTVEVEGEGAGQSLDVSGGGTLTGEGATINFSDTDYEVPQELFDGFAEGIADATGAAEEDGGESLDVDPVAWFTNLSNAGSEEVDGTETVRITGDADIAAIGQDLLRAFEESNIPGAELPQGFDASQLGLLEGFINEATIEVFSEADTYLLRRLDFNLSLQNLAAVNDGQGPDTAAFEFSITLNEPNEEQSIELPSDPRPFEDLEAAVEEEFGALLGDDFSTGLDDSGLDSGSDDATGGAGGGGGGGGGASENVPGVDQEYLDCIENADSPEALTECAEDL